jgi:hypothetical protein
MISLSPYSNEIDMFESQRKGDAINNKTAMIVK